MKYRGPRLRRELFIAGMSRVSVLALAFFFLVLFFVGWEEG